MTDDKEEEPVEEPDEKENFARNIQNFMHHQMHEAMVRQYWHDQKDPAKFPRSTEIIDEQSLMLLAERGVKLDQLNEMAQKIDILKSEIELISKKLFSRLRSVYPDVSSTAVTEDEQSPAGFRRFNKKWFFVSWDE